MDLPPLRRCGAVGRDAVVDWRVWAPRAKEVRLVLFHGAERTPLPMQADDAGYHALTVEKIPEGQLYAFQLDEGPPLPGPASLWQPHGIHGPSAVVLPKWFKWSDGDWRGVPRGKLVFYELHVGSFTHEGTFEAIRPRLAALRELGVTAIELMPVAQFPGTRNWGYDGVFPYAAQNSYGGPHGLQRLVDACHAEGLALFLDVVYNHLGPEGNYLAEYGPYFTDRYQTPWGQALNFDGAGSDSVRDYVLDNARMWLEEFHVDGLRLDAVHAIFDSGPQHIVAAIQEVADEVAQRTGRLVHVFAESNRNDPRLLLPPERGDGLDGQWADDFHHAVHAWLTGERQSYYADFGPARLIAKALESPFVFTGDYSRYRKRRHGAPAGDLSADRFVVCLQNHDQVGNRARGERLGTLLCPAKQRLAASLLLLSPYLPLLFMGEEYGETAPFPFYCSFLDSKLVEAVRAGRRREFAHLDGQQVPDPQAVETFAAAQLAWSWPEGTLGAGLRRLYGDLLAARRTWPALRDSTQRTARLLPDEDQGVVLELVRSGVESGADEGIHALFNLTGERQPLPIVPAAASRALFSSESARYLGERSQADGTTSLRAFECLVFGPSSWRAFR